LTLDAGVSTPGSFNAHQEVSVLRSLIASTAAAVLLSFAGPAQSAIFVFTAHMNGATEVPPNPSPAFGFTKVTVDDMADTMQVDVSWNGLTGGPPSAGHIHCCSAPGTNVGVAVPFPGLPATTTGVFHHLFDLTDASIYTLTFLNDFGGGTAAGAQTALVNGFFAGMAYSNLHNATFPGGEIRGQLAAVPEAGTWGLMILGFGAVGALLRRRRPVLA
jgi:hypothetical protein